MAREAAHALDLDGVLFVPAGQPSCRDPTRIAGTTGRCVGHMGEIRARFRLMNLLNCRKSERRRLAQRLQKTGSRQAQNSASLSLLPKSGRPIWTMR